MVSSRIQNEIKAVKSNWGVALLAFHLNRILITHTRTKVMKDWGENDVKVAGQARKMQCVFVKTTSGATGNEPGTGVDRFKLSASESTDRKSKTLHGLSNVLLFSSAYNQNPSDLTKKVFVTKVNIYFAKSFVLDVKPRPMGYGLPFLSATVIDTSGFICYNNTRL